MVVLAVALASCGGGGSGGATPPASGAAVLNFIAFEPYSGAESVFAPENLNGCLAGVFAVNQGGGVLGHQLACAPVDSRSDPADAVPAARKLLATTSNLVGIIGPSTNEAPSTVPLFDGAHIPMFAQTGDPAFDQSSYQYFYRPTPADDVNGYSMALWAQQKGYTKAATVFGNDVAGQGVVPNLVKGFTKLGGTVVIDLKLTLDQSSYRTEVERLVAAQPQVIFTELDPQTAATFYGELKQLHGLIPVIGDGGTIGYPAWTQAVSGAIGAQDMGTFYSGVQINAPTNMPGYQAYKDVLNNPAVKIKNPSNYYSDPYTETDYDGVIATALAMVAAKSTDPKVFNPFIVQVTRADPSATVVYSFKDGVAALQAGKTIQYVGAGGPQAYNQYHNSVMAFEADTVDAGGNTVQQGLISADAVAKLVNG